MEKIIRRIQFGEELKPYLYWLTKTPQERIAALELLRQQIYLFYNNGQNKQQHPRTELQRVFKIVKRQSS
jgi:hypothetical protein